MDIGSTATGNFTAICAGTVTLLALLVSYWTLKNQSSYNRYELTPLPWFFTEYGKDIMYINLENNGLGPLIIKRTDFIKGNQTHKILAHCFSDKSGFSEYYTFMRKDKPIKANDSFRIWQFTLDDDTDVAEKQRQEILDILKGIRAEIHYTDVYGRTYKPLIRTFEPDPHNNPNLTAKQRKDESFLGQDSGVPEQKLYLEKTIFNKKIILSVKSCRP